VSSISVEGKFEGALYAEIYARGGVELDLGRHLPTGWAEPVGYSLCWWKRCDGSGVGVRQWED
jgi:hypothetical protein